MCITVFYKRFLLFGGKLKLNGAFRRKLGKLYTCQKDEGRCLMIYLIFKMNCHKKLDLNEDQD